MEPLEPNHLLFCNLCLIHVTYLVRESDVELFSKLHIICRLLLLEKLKNLFNHLVSSCLEMFLKDFLGVQRLALSVVFQLPARQLLFCSQF